MVRKLRIAAVCTATAAAIVAAALWAAYLAARQVRPFYQQALQLDREVLERGRQEMESRATTLYSDARKVGAWQALFTDEQINGWLAVQLAEPPSADAHEITENIREPRIAISPGLLTLGFTTTQSGVDTVVSVDASVFLTDVGDVAIRLLKVRAGSLPLPAALVADELAAACRERELPVMWTNEEGNPVAIIEVGDQDAAHGRQWFVDAIELTEGELYVAGHTELATAAPDIVARHFSANGSKADNGSESAESSPEVNLDEFELRLASPNAESMLEIARRVDRGGSKPSRHAGR